MNDIDVPIKINCPYCNNKDVNSINYMATRRVDDISSMDINWSLKIREALESSKFSYWSSIKRKNYKNGFSWFKPCDYYCTLCNGGFTVERLYRGNYWEEYKLLKNIIVKTNPPENINLFL
jgi:hypothetical protein